jgi:hypothetical protein
VSGKGSILGVAQPALDSVLSPSLPDANRVTLFGIAFNWGGGGADDEVIDEVDFEDRGGLDGSSGVVIGQARVWIFHLGDCEPGQSRMPCSGVSSVGTGNEAGASLTRSTRICAGIENRGCGRNGKLGSYRERKAY